MTEALLVLADGTTFEGETMGAEPAGGVATGEIVFNTVLSGYQEVITDPSYAGQVITFTYPHIGNYGVNAADAESRRPFCRGVVVRDVTRRPSNWRASEGLDSYLRRQGVPGISGVDTRRLTRHIREAGSMPGAFGTADERTLKEAAIAEPSTDGLDLVATVTTTEPYRSRPASVAERSAASVAERSAASVAERSAASVAERSDSRLRVVAYDFGIKTSILRLLGEMATVEVVPASTPAADVLARRPDGVFLSNGPGDPAAVTYAIDAIRGLLGEVPVFGICLGHQLLGTALGGSTYKLKFGHHGGNHPVRRVADGSVEITSQNHNYAVAEGSVPNADVTHQNLNDGVIEGFRCRDVPAFSVQYHPEAGPGPHDARYLFDEFAELMRQGS